ncbi:TonB-dependent receptor [Luminiphilus sp.]|jgi:outer membrane receptor protein involved in Fe transport|nr:TonB-dependent receptor [Luminiphilus sp.]
MQRATSTILATASLALSVATQAQSGEGLLEEILVTAQKRQQQAIDVPIAIGTFSQRDIINTGALNLQDIDAYIVGFDAGGESFTQQGYRIRGISSPNISTGGDPSVATFYDDAYLPRAATTVAFADIDRVEVLRGPQGTLFGRNAAAGVVNMIPNAPSDTLEGFARIRAGNYNLMRLEGMINIPVSETFSLRANALANQRDGISENVEPAEFDAAEKGNWAGRIAMRWVPSEATTLQLAVDVDHFDQSPSMALGVSPFSLNTNPFSGRYANDVIDGEETRDMWGITGKWFQDLNEQWSMTAIANYRDFETSNRQDEDGTADPTRYFDTNNIEDSDITYTEVRFNYNTDRINAVMGATYSLENTYQRTEANALADSIARLVTQDFNAGFGFDMDHIWNPDDYAVALSAVGIPVTATEIQESGDFWYEFISGALGEPMLFGPSFEGEVWGEYIINEGEFENYGIYADVEYAISDRLSLTAGLRYSEDNKEFSWLIPATTFAALRPGVSNQIFTDASGDYAAAATTPTIAKDSWSKTTGRLVATYRLSEQLIAYGSVSTGYKAGGFDSLAIKTSLEPLQPENSEQYEIGLKGDLFDGRLQVQLAVFDLTVDGRQRSVETRPPGQDNAIPTVINVDSGVQGVELNVSWLITEDLLFTALSTYREEENQSEEFYDAKGELTQFDSSSDTAGNYTLTLDWRPKLAAGNLLVRGEYIYAENTRDADDANYNPDFESISGYTDDRRLVNGRIAWSHPEDHWELALWGRNLTDEDRISGISQTTVAVFGTPIMRILDPRTYGVEAIYRF